MRRILLGGFATEFGLMLFLSLPHMCLGHRPDTCPKDIPAPLPMSPVCPPYYSEGEKVPPMSLEAPRGKFSLFLSPLLAVLPQSDERKTLSSWPLSQPLFCEVDGRPLPMLAFPDDRITFRDIAVSAPFEISLTQIVLFPKDCPRILGIR